MTRENQEDCKYCISPLEKKHIKTDFKCGVDELDQYLKTQASQDIKKNVAVTHVLTLKHSEKIMGFYTLSSMGIFPGELPENIIKKLPRYPVLPGVLIGRLAVDQQYSGQGLGEYLLMDAFKRSLAISAQIGIVAVIVEAKNKKAIAFYKQYGFNSLPSHHQRLFLPLSTIKQLDLGAANKDGALPVRELPLKSTSIKEVLGCINYNRPKKSFKDTGKGMVKGDKIKT